MRRLSLLQEYSGYELMRLDDKSGESDIPLRQRTNTANGFGADFYLSIHHNAGIKGGIGGGIETYVYTAALKESLEWQSDLYKTLLEKTGLKGNRSNGRRKANLHECRESKMPCVLIECGYMDSKTDVPIILSDDFAAKVAEACVEVIVKKAALKKKANSVSYENKIYFWQKAAIKDGFKFSKYGADGKWGSECEKVAQKAVCKKRLTYKYKNLTKLVQEAVGVTADGKFGLKTKTAVMAFQIKNKLLADGIVGLESWKKILGVK